MQVLVEDVLGEPGVVGDLAELPTPLADRPQDGEVVPRLAELLLQEKIHLPEEERTRREDLAPDVAHHVLAEIELAEVPGHPAQDRIDFHALIEGPAPGQKLANTREVQRPDQQVPGPPGWLCRG